MPFKSEKQRRFMWANHPDIARRWAHETQAEADRRRRMRKRLGGRRRR